MLLIKMLQTFGEYLMLMGRVFSRPERFRMFWKRYVKEMAALGVDSIIIVLLISFFHRRCHLHPNQTQYRKRLDAQMGERLRHTRDHVAGILLIDHVFDLSR